MNTYECFPSFVDDFFRDFVHKIAILSVLPASSGEKVDEVIVQPWFAAERKGLNITHLMEQDM